ncbi:hypothetical protein E2P81_ATG09411 [Venturia nashicola]|nr:hypothetical protein E2P81_ATG09411 [Venturia nashicola]
MSDAKSDEQVTMEATLELEVLRHQMTSCAKTWLARTQHYRRKRYLEKAKYQVWEMSKKLLFFRNSKWRTEWHRKRTQLRFDAPPGSKNEIAGRERFERQSIPTNAKTHQSTEDAMDGFEVEAPRATIFGEGQQNESSGSRAPQRVGQYGRGKSEWDYITDKIKERRLTLEDVKKKGFQSRYDQHLEACEFDDWKREKRKKARELRDKAIADATTPIESSWAEPRVNWRELELGLKHGRKWKRFLQIGREEEKEMMVLRDQKRAANGFKLRERPAKRQIHLLDTEEVQGGTAKRTKLTKESAKQAEDVWLDNVKKAMRNQKRDEPSENGEDGDDGDEGNERPGSLSSRAPTFRLDHSSEPSATQNNVEKLVRATFTRTTCLGTAICTV